MSLRRRTAWWPILAPFVVLGVTLWAAGCGATASGTAASAEAGAARISDEYLDVLAERCDEVFPDDQVVTVRVVMDNADRARMRSDLVGKHFVEGRVASIAAQLSGEQKASYGDGSGNRGAFAIGGPGGIRAQGGPPD
jgi:hypothetical protein